MRAALALAALAGSAASAAIFALVVPNEVQEPGTQPLEVQGLISPALCDNCHGNYDPGVEAVHTWKGSAMAHAGRDPLFWAAFAIAERDFDGAGDLCLRCHAPAGWIAGASTPTDGSALSPSAHGGGVECALCHRMVNPDGSEHIGVQNPPYLAFDPGPPVEGWYGSGMYVLPDSDDRYGPYAGVNSPHASHASLFHRDAALCGTCHDVSNPVTGDLAPGNGAQVPLPPGSFSGVPGTPLTSKAAFLNAPYAYGMMERTFSEHQASSWAAWRVRDYALLPDQLQHGIVTQIWQAAQAAGRQGDYEDGTERSFSCQSCHMRPVVGKGADRNNSPVRLDLPLHDLVGGNTWIGDAILHLDGLGRLKLGGGLSAADAAAIADGQLAARAMLRSAARLEVEGYELDVINLTGHKLPTGYPEGRRMWLNVRWFGMLGQPLREDGRYGNLAVQHRGQAMTVRSLLDPHGPHTRVWEAQPGITSEWAARLLALGTDPQLVLSYDRLTGQELLRLADLAAMPGGSSAATFHFVLNDTLTADNRIPPWGFAYDEARRRNCLPVPADQYGAPGSGGSYDFVDRIRLAPPRGAVRAEIRLMYQTTSWEYVQFLDLANPRTHPTLAQLGADLFEAWSQTGMSEPEEMATAEWRLPRVEAR